MTSEIDAFDPVPEQVTLLSGTIVELESLRARQFFKFLRIITVGALPVLRDGGLFSTEGVSEDDYAMRLITAMMMAVPNAEDETIEWLMSMVRPHGVVSGRRMNKQDDERNRALWQELFRELDNPHLEDLVTLIEAIVKREASDLMALGKRLAAMFRLAQRTGQIPAEQSPSQTSPASNSSVDSPAHSTSSAPNTAGPTSSASTYPFEDFGSALQRFTSDASTPDGNSSNG